MNIFNNHINHVVEPRDQEAKYKANEIDKNAMSLYEKFEELSRPNYRTTKVDSHVGNYLIE